MSTARHPLPFWTGLLALLASVACGQQPAPRTSHGGPITDHVSFVDHLRREGLTVEIGDSVEQPFLRVPGVVLRVSGGSLTQPAELQSYPYEDAAAARADADEIGPKGSPAGTQIDWVAPPHFFRKEKVLVIYLGRDAKVVSLLADLLGPPFAGPQG